MATFLFGPSVGGVLSFDATLREEHAVENAVTDNPIETGGIVTDHVQTLPRVLTMDTIVSTTPDSLLGVAAGIDVGIPPSLQRHIDVWRRLEAAAEARIPLTVLTTLRAYQNMVIRRLTTPRTLETTNALIYTIEFRQVEIPIIDSTAAIAPPAQDSALGEQDLGPQGLQRITDVLNQETVNVGVSPV